MFTSGPFYLAKGWVRITGQILLCAGHGKEVEDESSLQADLKRSASLDKVILVREWLKEVDGKIRLERTETR